MGLKEVLSAGLNGVRGIGRIAILAIVGVFLIILSGQIGKNGADKNPDDSKDPYSSVRTYTEELESRIVRLCEQVDGVTEAHVLLSLDGGTEQVYAENTAGASVDYVIIEGKEGEGALLVREIYPRIRGVAVVCTRGGDSETQRIVTELLSAALGISTSRICVAGS